ncbi:MAG TPA: hypothetical protein VFF82_03005 [Rhodocyclaceae bacterium]|nr:hypothetical protein [Rhodocyclaceae bacterium]
MPYVARDAEGRIVAVAAQATESVAEAIDAGAAELQEYLAQIAPEAAGHLARSDLGLIRVVEDLIETLMDKNVLRFTDLPEAAQHKLMQRRSLRKSMNTLSLLGGADSASPVIKL